jgi:hypothetical protein
MLEFLRRAASIGLQALHDTVERGRTDDPVPGRPITARQIEGTEPSELLPDRGPPCGAERATRNSRRAGDDEAQIDQGAALPEADTVPKDVMGEDRQDLVDSDRMFPQETSRLLNRSIPIPRV